jgi:drug/metabolite transporter (DMT)-like permease
MLTIFALTSAVLFGFADFLGGAATRYSRVLSVVPVSAGAGALLCIAAVLVSGEQFRTAGLAWGVAAGAVGAVGLMVFYAGLAVGPMTIVAPVSALTATLLPVGVALAEGERASAMVYAGALLCLVAIVMVSSAAPEGSETRPATRGRGRARAFHGRAIAYGLTAGMTFGLFFILLRNAGQSGTLWLAASARLAGLAVILAAALVTRTRPVPAPAGAGTTVSPRLLLAAAGSGILDASANIFYITASRAGLFGLAVVLCSLYPGVTVLLARVTLGERMRRAQLAGLLLAGIGVVLVTL